MKVGAIIQACRERAGFSQEKLAELMHRSRSCISKFENNHKKPDVDEFIQLLNLTNAKEVAVAYLCGMDGVAIMTQILPFIGG